MTVENDPDTPYYDDGTARLYQGNCADVLPRLPAADLPPVALIVTSPPYDDLRTYGGHRFDFERVADALVPTLKDGGVLVWVVADATVDGAESGTSFRQVQGFVERGLILHDTMIYRKKSSVPRTWKRRHRNGFEFMFVLSRGKPATVNIIVDVPTATGGQVWRGKLRSKEGALETRQDRVIPDVVPRALLDRRVLCDLLGFDQDIYHAVRRLAARWCQEPSVHGGRTPAPEPEGAMLTAPTTPEWSAVRIADYALAQVAYGLEQATLRLPDGGQRHRLPVCRLADLGQRGAYILDLVGLDGRGPFDRGAPTAAARYPALWSHVSGNETRLVCPPDTALLVRPGMEAKAERAWATAARLHVNLKFRLTTQSLAAALTEQPTIGGATWPTFVCADRRHEQPLALWLNSTLGLLTYWWHANRQQAGRAQVSIKAIDGLLVLDPRALTAAQRRLAAALVAELRTLEFLPAYRADVDETRALLDRRLLCDLLGYDQDVYRAVRRLATRWCQEPSVHGGKLAD